MWVLAATAIRRLSGAVSPRARAGDAPEQCPSRRSPLSSRWHQPAISAISGEGSEQFPVEDKPGRGGHHSGCGGVGEDECLVITDVHWPEVKASAPPPAGPGPPRPGSRLGPRSPACGDGLGGPSGSAPLSRDAWPLSQLAHRAVDPGLPHVQALHRVQAGTPQRLTPFIPDGPPPVDVAPGSGCRWRCLEGPSCWPSGGSDPRWPPARRGYGGARRSGSPPAGVWELGQAPVPA